MLKEKGFYKGVNLGGWMSQCDYSFERLDGFITDKDIEHEKQYRIRGKECITHFAFPGFL